MNSEFHHSNLKYICYKLNLNTQKDEFLIKKYVKMWKNTWSLNTSYFCTFTFFLLFAEILMNRQTTTHHFLME